MIDSLEVAQSIKAHMGEVEEYRSGKVKPIEGKRHAYFRSQACNHPTQENGCSIHGYQTMLLTGAITRRADRLYYPI